MFNNLLSEKEYECYNVVTAAEEGRGALLIGDFNSATSEEVLKMHSIKTVITAAMGLEHLQIPSFVEHIVYPLQDAKTENIKSYFDESFLTIDKNLREGGVLVHCAAGISRSATLVIAYLMRKNQMGFKAAIAFLKSKRAEVCPNLGFEMQLKKYEAQLISEVKQQPKFSKKYASSKPTEDHRRVIELTQIKKKPQSPCLFEFIPLLHTRKKKGQVKKGSMNMGRTGYSRPRSKHLYDVMETQLFISGQSAKRPASRGPNEDNSHLIGRRSPFMGTWAPLLHQTRQFGL